MLCSSPSRSRWWYGKAAVGAGLRPRSSTPRMWCPREQPEVRGGSLNPPEPGPEVAGAGLGVDCSLNSRLPRRFLLPRRAAVDPEYYMVRAAAVVAAANLVNYMCGWLGWCWTGRGEFAQVVLLFVYGVSLRFVCGAQGLVAARVLRLRAAGAWRPGGAGGCALEGVQLKVRRRLCTRSSRWVRTS